MSGHLRSTTQLTPALRESLRSACYTIYRHARRELALVTPGQAYLFNKPRPTGKQILFALSLDEELFPRQIHLRKTVDLLFPLFSQGIPVTPHRAHKEDQGHE